MVHVDRTQTDPLLKFALVSQPQLTLDVSVTKADVAPFTARQGFTDVRVTGGHYQVRRTEDITLRDPDGRGLLTLEDLRYSTLPDLFRITPDPGPGRHRLRPAAARLGGRRTGPSPGPARTPGSARSR